MIRYSIAIMSSKPGTKKAEIKETKAYGVSQVNKKLSLDEFAEHMANHNSPFSAGAIAGILKDAVSCLREILLEGNKVSLGDLGDFHCELSTTGAVTTDDFSTANIKAVNVCWSPGKRFKNLRQDATFKLVPGRKAEDDAIEVVKNSETIHGLE